MRLLIRGLVGRNLEPALDPLREGDSQCCSSCLILGDPVKLVYGKCAYTKG